MERYRAVILVLVGLLSLRFLLAEKTEQSDCNDSGLKNKDNTVIYTAKDCRPTTCEATVSFVFYKSICCKTFDKRR